MRNNFGLIPLASSSTLAIVPAGGKTAASIPTHAKPAKTAGFADMLADARTEDTGKNTGAPQSTAQASVTPAQKPVDSRKDIDHNQNDAPPAKRDAPDASGKADQSNKSDKTDKSDSSDKTAKPLADTKPDEAKTTTAQKNDAAANPGALAPAAPAVPVAAQAAPTPAHGTGHEDGDAALAAAKSGQAANAAVPLAQDDGPRGDGATGAATGAVKAKAGDKTDTKPDGRTDKADAKADAQTGMKTDAKADAQALDKTAAAPQPAAAQPSAPQPPAPPAGAGGHTASLIAGASAPTAPAPHSASTVSAQFTVAPQTHAEARPDVTGLALQIFARSQSGAKQFDIRLDPPELGRVDVRLSIDATGKASAHLTADQPQTLDLLQKDSTNLTRALRDAGLDVSQNSLAFSLKSNSQGHQGSADGRQARTARGSMALTAARTIDATPSLPVFRSTGTGDARLDIHV